MAVDRVGFASLIVEAWMPTIAQVRRWGSQVNEVTELISGSFFRREQREHTERYLRGLISRRERKNSWQLAEQLGDATPVLRDGRQGPTGGRLGLLCLAPLGAEDACPRLTSPTQSGGALRPRALIHLCAARHSARETRASAWQPLGNRRMF